MAAEVRRGGRAPAARARRGETCDQLNTEALGALLDYQTSVLDRLEEVHQVLVQIVLAGGSVEDLCEQLVRFLDGAAIVTTTDGRVLASAGSEGELEHALALDCFDRTGRLITEKEPVGIRPQVGPTAHRAAVRIVAGSLDHGLLTAFCSHRMLGPDDVRLLERAATVAALAITKEQAVSAVESKYRAEFLRDALAGRPAPRKAVAPPSPSGGTSTAPWWSWWRRPTRTTSAPPARPTRCARCSTASPGPGPTPCRSATRRHP